jgi:hypothetical protein
MEQIVFKAPKGTKARLSELAADYGEDCSVSDLCRQAVDALLEKRKSASAHDKAPHLCGSVEMPPDAATNDDYLKQYAGD